MPAQAESEEAFKQMEAMGAGAEEGMLFTLIVPFCFMVFMSVSLDRVWGLYNML